jgi:hypothetical protein
MWLDEVEALIRADVEWQAGLTQRQIDEGTLWFRDAMAQSYSAAASGLRLFEQTFREYQEAQ